MHTCARLYWYSAQPLLPDERDVHICPAHWMDRHSPARFSEVGGKAPTLAPAVSHAKPIQLACGGNLIRTGNCRGAAIALREGPAAQRDYFLVVPICFPFLADSVRTVQHAETTCRPATTFRLEPTTHRTKR